MQQKKRHHFIPKAYLKAFENEKGQVQVYRKENPGRILPAKPDSTQFERYYYSQPLPEGGRDNNTLEDVFGEVETTWPHLVERLAQKGSVNEELEAFLQFVALQRARVPAARDAVEAMMAANVLNVLNALKRAGKLPPPPPGLENMLDHIEVAIDPHQSLHAIPAIITKMGELFDTVGFAVIHNESNTPFLTSDNPVAWYDPSVPFEQQRPYAISPNGPVVIQFPISPRMMLLGACEYRDQYLQHGLMHTSAADTDWVDCVNAQTCRFGYDAIIAQAPGQETLIKSHCETSPVLDTSSFALSSGGATLGQFVFGARKEKPKWRSQGNEQR